MEKTSPEYKDYLIEFKNSEIKRMQNSEKEHKKLMALVEKKIKFL